MKQLLSRSSLLGALGATAALAAVALVRAGDSGGDVTMITSVTSSPSNSSAAGLVAAKDPVTGALRAPTAEEIAALQPSREGKGREGAPLRSQRLANGAVVTTLDSSYDLYEVASKDANGKIQTACVPANQFPAVMKAAQNGDLNKKEVLDEK